MFRTYNQLIAQLFFQMEMPFYLHLLKCIVSGYHVQSSPVQKIDSWNWFPCHQKMDFSQTVMCVHVLELPVWSCRGGSRGGHCAHTTTLSGFQSNFFFNVQYSIKWKDDLRKDHRGMLTNVGLFTKLSQGHMPQDSPSFLRHSISTPCDIPQINFWIHPCLLNVGYGVYCVNVDSVHRWATLLQLYQVEPQPFMLKILQKQLYCTNCDRVELPLTEMLASCDLLADISERKSKNN